MNLTLRVRSTFCEGLNVCTTVATRKRGTLPRCPRKSPFPRPKTAPRRFALALL